MPVSSSPRRRQKAVQRTAPTKQPYRYPTPEERANLTARYDRQINALYENPKNNAGKGAGEASLILGIIGVICWFFGYSTIISIIAGAIGLREASVSKNAGYDGAERRIGGVLSGFSLVVGLIILIFFWGTIAALINSM